MSSETTVELPGWEQCAERVRAGEATALEDFIYQQEPAGEDGELMFREQLRALVQEIRDGR